jgi:hypothetical protein
MRTTLIPALGLACLALAGCGSDSQGSFEEPERSGPATGSGLLPATDVARVQQAMESISSDCEGATDDDAQTLVQVFEEGPEAIYEPGNANVGKSMTEVLEIKRDELAECGRDDLAAELDQALGEA